MRIAEDGIFPPMTDLACNVFPKRISHTLVCFFCPDNLNNDQPWLDGVRSSDEDGATGGRRVLARHEGRNGGRTAVVKVSGTGCPLAPGEGFVVVSYRVVSALVI